MLKLFDAYVDYHFVYVPKYIHIGVHVSFCMRSCVVPDGGTFKLFYSQWVCDSDNMYQ